MNTFFRQVLLLSFGVVLVGCLVGCDALEDDARLVGQLERDRISLVAETNDPLVEIPVNEGDRVAQGQLLARQDSSLLDHSMERLQAEAGGAQARLDELVRGPRQESIRAAEARLEDARSRVAEATANWRRVEELREQDLVSAAELDSAIQRKESAKAAFAASRAELDSLLEGATVEELEQARASVKAARAAVAELSVRMDRLTLDAPMEATVEALPFEIGERPAPGQSVAVLLASGPPHAVVFIPAARRAEFAAGTKVTVAVDGFGEFPGQVRYITSEAAFTPYFSLTQRERGRLSYRAEIDLTGDDARALPAGIPVYVSAESEYSDGGTHE